MGNAIIRTGGAGADSDELTANKSQVLENYTAITHDSDGDPAAGTMPHLANRSTISHSTSISTKVILGDVALISTNTDGVSRAEIRYNGTPGYLTANTLIGIPAGVMAVAGGLSSSKLLKGQTAFGIAGTATSDANATKDKLLTGSSAYVNGVKINGELSVQSVVNFKAAQYSNLTLIASWAYPSKGPWSGLRILCKQGSYPANVNDGTLFYEGSGTSATKTLPAGTWYIRAWNYLTTNKGRLYGNYHSATVVNNEIRGQQVFTSSGLFTVPDKVYEIELFLVGAGGSGGKSTYYESEGQGGPGGCGGCTLTRRINAAPGSTHTINIGAPITASPSNNGINKSGSTSFDNIIAEGGESAYTWSYTYQGWHGGSGGGHAGESRNFDAGDGGFDGSNGIPHAFSLKSGTGQNSSTRAFGEPNNTLYAGGGGGGGYVVKESTSTGSVGYGGAGGGGNGGYGGKVSYRLGNPGTPNTGGGGGGGGCIASNASNWEGGLGGSGICIVRWGY